MAIAVACLISPENVRYNAVAKAMAAGVRRCGDRAVICDVSTPAPADVAVMYGWKRRAVFSNYRHFVYADLGYWQRKKCYRLSVDSWGQERYVSAGLPGNRLAALGITVKPWRKSGQEIVIAGSTLKSARDHGMRYMEWECKVAAALKNCGRPLMYRPKPRDAEKKPIAGIGYDQRPIEQALSSSWAWVTHHSNSAIEALVAGVPVHCETGAAAAFSVPLDQLAAPPLLDGRERFLQDVAWLQWTLAEMEAGECWSHLKARGLFA